MEIVDELKRWVAGWTNKNFFPRSDFIETSFGGNRRGSPIKTWRNGFIHDSLFMRKGTWTAAQAGVTLTQTSGYYRKWGDMVHIGAYVQWPVTADTTNISLTGLPFSVVSWGDSFYPGFLQTNMGTILYVLVSVSDQGVRLYNEGGSRRNNSHLSGDSVRFSAVYLTDE